mgnify:CR=1 FL=1
MKIGSINLAGDAVLAPIAGFTDVGFRDIAARYGATLTYTEMISCKGMVYGSEKTKELLATTDNEKVKAVQIFGNDPHKLSCSAAVKSPSATPFFSHFCSTITTLPANLAQEKEKNKLLILQNICRMLGQIVLPFMAEHEKIFMKAKHAFYNAHKFIYTFHMTHSLFYRLCTCHTFQIKTHLFFHV